MDKSSTILRSDRLRLVSLGLTVSLAVIISACSNRPLHLTPPNRADSIVDVSTTKIEDSETIISRIKDEATRNKEQFKLISTSDIYCGDFISSIYGRRAVTNVWYSAITTATAAAAAVVGGRAAQNLAGTSAVTNEVRSSINNEMYGGELIPTVAKEIGGLRKTELVRITPLQEKPLNIYSGAAAIADAIKYHELCSIPIAISSILNRANQRYGVSTLDLDGSIQRLDAAIANNQKLLADQAIASDAIKKKELADGILDLTQRRNTLIKTFSIPGFQTIDSQKASGGGAATP
ncbi:hypothetical protein [Pseudomonas sp. BC42]|uniref:hypothetical protein n=1 Tax=Pseudomonas sp. BC42 TaxID=2933816 RepID=UPI001F366AB8|nr:hypothetical protein [Pseudomonas sp. BC42]ULT68185.1 hypothetical protein L1O02_17360 [Pseudomonas sp. BC42]